MFSSRTYTPTVLPHRSPGIDPARIRLGDGENLIEIIVHQADLFGFFSPHSLLSHNVLTCVLLHTGMVTDLPEGTRLWVNIEFFVHEAQVTPSTVSTRALFEYHALLCPLLCICICTNAHPHTYTQTQLYHHYGLDVLAVSQDWKGHIPAVLGTRTDTYTSGNCVQSLIYPSLSHPLTLAYVHSDVSTKDFLLNGLEHADRVNILSLDDPVLFFFHSSILVLL